MSTSQGLDVVMVTALRAHTPAFHAHQFVAHSRRVQLRSCRTLTRNVSRVRRDDPRKQFMEARHASKQRSETFQRQLDAFRT
eukprot:3832937-Pleurochrysis_carterae.AAC.2